MAFSMKMCHIVNIRIIFPFKIKPSPEGFFKFCCLTKDLCVSKHLCQRKESGMLLASIRSFRVCISHQSDRRIRVCISHHSERRFCSLVQQMFKVQRSNGGFGESGSSNGIIFQNEKCWLFCVFNVHFAALYEKCDTSGQMKDIRLSIVNMLLML